ncbi:Arc family DNA-binding protein [Acinetobacter sp. C32I]|uniref:Arc family DNA-binding protein n=1 Tax=Acinetobacter sp. C32I TaxID=2950074 RepID=UPI002036EE7D|nr:Arc family DNA-binding protein [Acinetobacter sp. C32I]USA54558.1 Arc family DNA-binding protein [Acinetobacter sp. C32I]
MNEDDNKVVTMKVRVTPEFREKLVTTAKGNNRSMNAEIVDRLEKSFETNQSIYIGAFTDAGVKILSHVMTSLKESGLSDDQIKEIFNGFKLNKDE